MRTPIIYSVSVTHSCIENILKDVEKIISVCCLSDGSILLLSKKSGKVNPVLTKYDYFHSEEILYDGEMDFVPESVVEVCVDGTKSVALLTRYKN